MNKQTINIALDIETLSKRPTAAIISIAAKCFTFEGNQDIDNLPNFTYVINASTCAMYGLRIDMDTVEWWSRQSEEAKRSHLANGVNVVSIYTALCRLKEYYEDIHKEYPDATILIWCQGTDFDISIIRNAYQTVLGTDAPWPYDHVRDSRTFIHGLVGLINPEVENPYEVIPKNPNWKAHDALSDCDQLIWNVRNVAQMFTKPLRVHENAEIQVSRRINFKQS